MNPQSWATQTGFGVNLIEMMTATAILTIMVMVLIRDALFYENETVSII